MADVSIGGELSPRLHAKRDSIVYSHGWSDGSRTEEMEKTFSRNLSADGEWWNFSSFFFLPLKRTMTFVLFRVWNSRAPCLRFPAIDQRNLSDDVASLSFGENRESRNGSLPGTIDGKAKLPIYRRWCVLPFLLPRRSTSRIFHHSRGEVFFFFLFDPKRVAEGFQNFRIARELRDVIVNVNIFVEIRGNIASNREGESKTREEKGKKGNKNK